MDNTSVSVSVSVAYQEGYKAYWEDKKQNDNPYRKTDIEHSDWLSGFYDALDEDNFYAIDETEFL